MCIYYTKQQCIGGKRGQFQVGFGAYIRNEYWKILEDRDSQVERFRAQCRAMASQSGVDIAGGKSSGRRAGHAGGGGRIVDDTLLWRRRKGAEGDEGVARHLIILSEA